MNDIDHNAERAFEDRKDLLEQQDRERRGVHLCACCGEETKEEVRCEGPECNERGCKGCMFYDPPTLGWYCSERCLGEKLAKLLDDMHGRIQNIIAQRDLLFEACTQAAYSESPKELIQYHLAQVRRQVKDMK